MYIYIGMSYSKAGAAWGEQSKHPANEIHSISLFMNKIYHSATYFY